MQFVENCVQPNGMMLMAMAMAITKGTMFGNPTPVSPLLEPAHEIVGVAPTPTQMDRAIRTSSWDGYLTPLVQPMLSHWSPHSGRMLTETALVMNKQDSKATVAETLLGPVGAIDLVARTQMVTDGQTKATDFLTMQLSGWMPTAMDLVTIQKVTKLTNVPTNP